MMAVKIRKGEICSPCVCICRPGAFLSSNLSYNDVLPTLSMKAEHKKENPQFVGLNNTLAKPSKNSMHRFIHLTIRRSVETN